MGSVLIRNLDDEVIAKLRVRAAENGRSMEAELRVILNQVLSREPKESFWDLAAKARALTAGTKQTPSEVLLRESRDEDAR